MLLFAQHVKMNTPVKLAKETPNLEIELEYIYTTHKTTKISHAKSRTTSKYLW